MGSIASVPLRRSRFETQHAEDGVLELVQNIKALIAQLWRFDELPELESFQAEDRKRG